MTEHTVRAYDDELRQLSRKVTEMGGHAESIVAQAVSALMRGDKSAADAIIAQDLILDNLQHELDERAFVVIAKRQPMAVDLREIIGALRMAGDLERIGDMGKSIAKRTKEVAEVTFPKKVLHGLDHLNRLALEQLKNVLDAYVHKDVEKAREVISRDDEIDQVYTSLFRELLTYMMEDPRNITLCTHLLFCAKNIERIGDHATNLAETIEYIITGKSALSTHGTRPGQQG
jgi:phosphate transport system protein